MKKSGIIARLMADLGFDIGRRKNYLVERLELFEPL